MKRTQLTSAIFLLIFPIITTSNFAQEMTQTIRGKIIDQDSKTSLIGANIIIPGSNPVKGTSSDINGYFRINQVHIGSVDLKITCMGYEDKIIPNILVGSGKEIVLEIELLKVLHPTQILYL